MLAVQFITLLAALTSVESNGNPEAYNAKEDAVGVLQIRPIMVEEVNRILRKYERQQGQWSGSMHTYQLADRKFVSTSRSMAMIYFRYWGERYKKETGNTPTMEYYARIWNGGPDGWKKESTIQYWDKVVAELNRIRKQGEQND